MGKTAKKMRIAKKTHLVHVCQWLIFGTAMFVVLVPFPQVLSQNTTVGIMPANVTTTPSQNFSINITAINVLDLYGWEIRMTWDPNLLNLISATEGPFLSSHGDTFFTIAENLTTGTLVIDGTLLGLVPGVSGSGTLAFVTFQSMIIGQCSLNLYNVTLIDSHEIPMVTQTQSGFVQSVTLHDVAVTSVAVSPNVTLPENPISINVTVANEGIYPETFSVSSYANSTLVGSQQVSLGNGSSTVLPFTWNTVGYQKGDYPILAVASTVPEETNTDNNAMYTDSPVTILYDGHDVAVIKVRPLKTIVGQNYSMYVDVTVKNYGTFGESCSTTLYVNSSALETQTALLPSEQSATLRFLWNTTGWTMDNYSISAYATPVPGETDTLNNEQSDGTVSVAWPADINGDGRVDMRDVGIACTTFDSTPNSPHWNPNADVNNDLKVNMRDIGLACANFGRG